VEWIDSRKSILIPQGKQCFKFYNCLPTDSAEEAFFKDYLQANEEYLQLMTLWVIATHGPQYAKYAPILAVTSPTKGCGKSTALELVNCIADNSVFKSNITTAGIYRLLGNGPCTLIIDEADTYLDGNTQMVGVLNNLFTNNKSGVVRCNTDSGFKIEIFDQFGFVAVGKIGSLPPTIADRSINVVLQKSRYSSNLKKFKGKNENSDILRDSCSKWMNENGSTLKDMEYPRIQTNNPREADKIEYLLAIAYLLGPNVETIFKSYSYPENRATYYNEEELPIELLSDCRAFFESSKKDRISTGALIDAINTMNESKYWNGILLTPKILAKFLGPFGLKPKTIRVGSRTVKGYLLEDFRNVFDCC